MSLTNCPWAAVLLLSLAPLLPGQTPVARTSDGHPDLQGIWTNITLTPLERPKEFAGKEFYTEQEAKDFEQHALEKRATDPEVPGDSVNDKSVWWEQGTSLSATRRTSMVFDPKDGKIPPLTPEASSRMQAGRAHTRAHPADGPEDRSLQERCLLMPSTGPPMLPGPYNNNYVIVQTPESVAIFSEMIHDVRVIPMDGRPHLPQAIRQWRGDSRGRWEGDTLVVETTNFTDKTDFHGSDRNLRLTERFRRVDAATIVYQFTVDDPTAFTRPWTAELSLRKIPGPVYEFACHEGNRAMESMLATARAAEKTAGAK
jgi:hypothetical protein